MKGELICTQCCALSESRETHVVVLLGSLIHRYGLLPMTVSTAVLARGSSQASGSSIRSVLGRSPSDEGRAHMHPVLRLIRVKGNSTHFAGPAVSMTRGLVIPMSRSYRPPFDDAVIGISRDPSCASGYVTGRSGTAGTQVLGASDGRPGMRAGVRTGDRTEPRTSGRTAGRVRGRGRGQHG